MARKKMAHELRGEDAFAWGLREECAAIMAELDFPASGVARQQATEDYQNRIRQIWEGDHALRPQEFTGLAAILKDRRMARDWKPGDGLDL